jgi:hypothetical protein
MGGTENRCGGRKREELERDDEGISRQRREVGRRAEKGGGGMDLQKGEEELARERGRGKSWRGRRKEDLEMQERGGRKSWGWNGEERAISYPACEPPPRGNSGVTSILTAEATTEISTREVYKQYLCLYTAHVCLSEVR